MTDDYCQKTQQLGFSRTTYGILSGSRQSLQMPKPQLKILENIRALNLQKTNELNSIYCPQALPSPYSANLLQLNQRRSSKPECISQHFQSPKKVEKAVTPTYQQQQGNKQLIKEGFDTSNLLSQEKKLSILTSILGKSQSSQQLELKTIMAESANIQFDSKGKVSKIPYQKQNSTSNLDQYMSTSIGCSNNNLSSTLNNNNNNNNMNEVDQNTQKKKKSSLANKLYNTTTSQSQQGNQNKFSNRIGMSTSSGIFTTGNLNGFNINNGREQNEFLPLSPKLSTTVSPKNVQLQQGKLPMKNFFKYSNNSSFQKQPQSITESQKLSSQQLSPKNRLSRFQFVSSPLATAPTPTSGQFYYPSSKKNSFGTLLQQDSIQETSPIIQQTMIPRIDQIHHLGQIIESGEPWRMRLEEIENEKNQLIQILMKERNIKDQAISQLHQLISTQSILQNSETAKQQLQELLELNEDSLRYQVKNITTNDHSSSKANSPTRIGESTTYQSEFNSSILCRTQKATSPKNLRCNNSNLSEQTTFRISLKRSSLPCSPNRRIIFDLQKLGKGIEGGKNDDYLFQSISPLKMLTQQNIQTNNTSLTLNHSAFGNNLYSNNLGHDQIGGTTNPNLSSNSILSNPEEEENSLGLASPSNNNELIENQFRKKPNLQHDALLFDSLQILKERMSRVLNAKRKQKVN